MADHRFIVEDKGAVRILRLNVPERRNAMSAELRSLMLEEFIRIEGDDQIRAVVLTGNGGTFCAGGDISTMGGRSLATGRSRMRETNRLVRQMLHLTKPVIAAVEGWAVGAGLSLAMACDTVVAARTARFLAGFAQIGLIADMGLLYTLPHRIGIGKTKQILFYNEKIEAEDALAQGLVDRLADEGQALDVALEMAARLALAAPMPIALTKSVLAEGLETLLEREGDLQNTLFQSQDHQEGRLAFTEKRKPVFVGR